LTIAGLVELLEITRAGERRAAHHCRLDQVVCAMTMCAGTAAGGWRIIKNARPQNGAAAPGPRLCAGNHRGNRVAGGGALGMPVSTDHAISTSIMGVAAPKALTR